MGVDVRGVLGPGKSEDLTPIPLASHRGVFEMRGKTFRVVVFLVVCLFSILAWSDCGMAQQQTEYKPAANPLVRVLQANGILAPDDVAPTIQTTSPNTS